MTYMPTFKQAMTAVSHEDQTPGEATLLKLRSRQGLSRLLIKSSLAAPKSVYLERLETELQIIDDKGFCSYFLIVADYVNWAKDNGIAVGPGRGSGPCSLVGFALGITKVDPIRYELPFERFVNPERQALPDFDLDFCDERYGEVTSYIQSEYGTDRVAQISSANITPLPSRLVICDRPLAGIVPLYQNPKSGFPATSMTIPQIADAGLVQFNVINQKALTLIQRTVQQLAKSGTAIDIDHIALDDDSTYQLLSTGEASNIEILDNAHYKNALIAVRPDRFENLYAVIALCQPRLQSDIPIYAERRRDAKSISYYHPALESITAETYGLILYQEQVMTIAQEIAGFSMAQSDSFRRTLKNYSRETTNIYKNTFIDGAIKYGLPQTEATGLFEQVATAGQHSFNKSHAVAYAMIAYQTAWLKANYSQEFYMAQHNL